MKKLIGMLIVLIGMFVSTFAFTQSLSEDTCSYYPLNYDQVLLKESHKTLINVSDYLRKKRNKTQVAAISFLGASAGTYVFTELYLPIPVKSNPWTNNITQADFERDMRNKRIGYAVSGGLAILSVYFGVKTMVWDSRITAEANLTELRLKFWIHNKRDHFQDKKLKKFNTYPRYR